MGIFLFDELTGTPTVLATNRIKRSDQTGAVSEPKKDAPKADSAPKPCYFCKGNESLTPPAVYQDADDWNVRVFVNKFPIVDYHEVIVHSSHHDLDLTELPDEQNVRYVRALLNRVNYYTSQGLEIMIFNNRGGKAGASILHPHSQLVALAGFPGIIEREKQEAIQYYNEHHSCYWCDQYKSELVIKERIVYESNHFVVLVPKASRWSYEMILIPKAHRPNFEYINEVEINDFARVLKGVLAAYDNLFDKPDRNFWIHSQRYDPYHWHLGFIPHLKVVGGLELGAGIWVSDRASPEQAAQELGDAMKKALDGTVATTIQ